MLTNPEQRRRLVADPALAPSAVEEVLRLSIQGTAGGPVGAPRYAREDIEIDGVTIRAGDLVLLNAAAANRDERVFPYPDRFDIGRAQRAHLAFGHGPRYCIGAALARMELEAVFTRFMPRFPTLRLAVPLEELTFRDGSLRASLRALPVAW